MYMFKVVGACICMCNFVHACMCMCEFVHACICMSKLCVWVHVGVMCRIVHCREVSCMCVTWAGPQGVLD